MSAASYITVRFISNVGQTVSTTKQVFTGTTLEEFLTSELPNQHRDTFQVSVNGSKKETSEYSGTVLQQGDRILIAPSKVAGGIEG
jgi:sulfur carrier protein ThiS